MPNKSKFRMLCGLFCCPPTITSIKNKITFTPPNPATYSITINSEGTIDIKFSNGQFSSQIALPGRKIEPYLISTTDDTMIACLHFILFESPLYTILYSHGNASDLGHNHILLMELGICLNCNVVSYDYSGYGLSTGVPSEQNIIKNIENVYNYMVKNLKIEKNKIILYGQSLGSVPTINLASKEEVAGVILQSALASGLRLIFPNLITTPFFDVFNKYFINSLK
uniref:Alpha/beta hydrolase domain-containing protein 17C (Trinotate prediction) n=1 Tax=Myxobolus squamalis TaxID=59785 RepID=A0A6B2G4Y8_MYXSQ